MHAHKNFSKACRLSTLKYHDKTNFKTVKWKGGIKKIIKQAPTIYIDTAQNQAI